MDRRIASLENRHGEKLHCILEEPDGGSAGARFGALLLCSGVKTRVGPHRLYRKLLPPFLARGIPVMRVDFAGLGDSEGEWPEDSTELIYRRTELGRCVGDVRSAFDWLQAHCGIRRFIAGGLCGAAITALHVAAQDRRLAALYAIGLPVTVHGSGSEGPMTRAELRSHRVRYLRKLLHPRSWLRFLSMRSDYRLMWRLVVDMLAGKANAPHIETSPRPEEKRDKDFNPHFAPAFFDVLAERRPALLMYGEDDPLRYAFEERFMQPWWGALEQYRTHFSYAVIPAANHILAEPAAIAEANRLAGQWLDAILAEQSARRGIGWNGVSAHGEGQRPARAA